jgi:hypothetical protein
VIVTAGRSTADAGSETAGSGRLAHGVRIGDHAGVRPALLLVAAVALASCNAPPPEPLGRRAYESPTGGYSVMVPAGWKVLQGEARSPSGTLVTVKVLSLENAEEEFRNGLPESIVPQLAAWARYFFQVVGEPTRTPTTLGGVPALQVVYPIRIRERDPLGQAAFWVAQHGSSLYVVRVTSQAGVAASEENDVREFIASWKFTGLATGDGEAPPGSYYLDVPPRPRGEQTPVDAALAAPSPGAGTTTPTP